MLSAPCKDCPDRVVGCHSTCEKYQQYKKKNDEIRRQIRLSKQATKFPVILFPEDDE